MPLWLAKVTHLPCMDLRRLQLTWLVKSKHTVLLTQPWPDVPSEGPREIKSYPSVSLLTLQCSGRKKNQQQLLGNWVTAFSHTGALFWFTALKIQLIKAKAFPKHIKSQKVAINILFVTFIFSLIGCIASLRTILILSTALPLLTCHSYSLKHLNTLYLAVVYNYKSCRGRTP